MTNRFVNFLSALPDLQTAPARRYEAGEARRKVLPLEAHVEAVRSAGRVDPLTILAAAPGYPSR